MSYNPFSLVGKTIFVTGASSGIGRATAIECSKMGAKLVITGRNETRLKETYLELEGDNHISFTASLDDVDNLEELERKIPKIDGIVHSAGYVKSLIFSFVTKYQLEAIMNVNFLSPTLLSQMLIKKKKITKGCSIVFISSISGVKVSAYGNAMYSASKGAVNGIVKGMALDLSSKGIRVNSVTPGMINTNIFGDGELTEEQLHEDIKKYPLKRYGEPKEVAHAVIYLLSDASNWVTGSNLLIDGGYTLL